MDLFPSMSTLKSKRPIESLAGLTLEKLHPFVTGCGLLVQLPLRGQETKFDLLVAYL